MKKERIRIHGGWWVVRAYARTLACVCRRMQPATTHSFRVLSFVVFDVELNPLGFGHKWRIRIWKRKKWRRSSRCRRKWHNFCCQNETFSRFTQFRRTIQRHILFVHIIYLRHEMPWLRSYILLNVALLHSFDKHRTRGPEEFDLPKMTFTAEGGPSLLLWFNCDFS